MTTDHPIDPPLLILCRDLLFASKITATAQTLGTAYVVVRDPAKLPGMSGRKLLVDLNQEGAIDAAAAWWEQTGREAVGFVSHVDGATIARAREAGIDQVLPRSQFAARLAELVRAS